MNSDKIKKGLERAPHRSLLRALGGKEDDFDKPFIGVCNSFCEIVPGHMHLNEVGRLVILSALIFPSTSWKWC